MKAMILAAGRGERLRPLTDRTPKPLLPIRGAPLIVHQIRWLQAVGIHEIVVNLHHLGEKIERVLGDGARLGVHIHYSREPDLLDTGGGIRNALPYLGAEPFVVLNGDIWTDYPFGNLLAIETDNAHLVLTPTPAHKAKADFHLEAVAGVDRVRRGVADDLTYCGIALVHPALFTGAPAGAFPLTDLLFPGADAGRLTGEVFEGTWFDIGTPDQLELARTA